MSRQKETDAIIIKINAEINRLTEQYEKFKKLNNIEDRQLLGRIEGLKMALEIINSVK